jgi:type IV secretion system protein VirB4
LRFSPWAPQSTDKYMHLLEHATPFVVLLRSGAVFAMLQVDGMPAQTLDADVLYQARRALNHTICGLDATDGLVLYSWVCRGFAPESVYPQGNFRSAFAAQLDRRYRDKLLDRFLFLNKTYLGIMLRPPMPAGEWVGNKLAKLRRDRDITDETPIERIRRLMRVCDMLRADLERYKPRQLGLREANGRTFSEISEALAFAMTGVWRQVGLQANRRVGMLFSERIIVGPEAIEIRGPGESSWAACFGAKHMMWNAPPGALDGFLAAPFRSTIAQSFRPIPTQAALTLMGRKQNRMVSSGDRASSQIAELDLAMDEVQSNRMTMGQHGLVITVFSDDLPSMKTVATRAWNTLQTAGAQVAREDAALESAFFSMLPGNLHRIPRPGVVTSWNYASLAGMHAYPAGEETGFWDVPIALYRTTGGTPFRHHLHVNQSLNAFCFGSTRSGKSTWLGWIIAQSERLGAQVVVWDKDRGLEIVCRAVGGRYLTLRNPTGLAPLKALTDSAEDIHHLGRLIRGKIGITDDYVMTPEEDRRLIVGLRAIMALPPRDRWMKDLRAFLGTSNSGAGARLEKWCWGNEYGWVSDNPQDVVDLDAPVLGFDVTEFLSDPMVAGPVMTQLLYRTGKLCDGRRLIYIVDEGWKVVDIPAFAEDAMDGFKTGGKKNFGVIFATQSVPDALKSKIGHTIREQCKTLAAFAVERPDRADLKQLKYSDRECEIIEDLKPGTGTFLLSQADRSVVVQLPLGDMQDDIAVLSGNELNVQILDDVRADLGDPPPEQLISEFHRRRKGVGMKKTLAAAVCLVALCGTARAQGIAVHDNANLIEQIQELATQAKTYAVQAQQYVTQNLQWTKQVQQYALQAQQFQTEAEQLLAFVHDPSLGTAGMMLNQTGLGNSLPVNAYAAQGLINGVHYGNGGIPELSGILSGLSSLSTGAYAANHVYSPTDNLWASQQLIANGNSIAGTQGATLAAYGDLRTHAAALQSIRDKLSTATNPKDVQDLQAQIELETTWSTNQQAQLVALKATWTCRWPAVNSRQTKKSPRAWTIRLRKHEQREFSNENSDCRGMPALGGASVCRGSSHGILVPRPSPRNGRPGCRLPGRPRLWSTRSQLLERHDEMCTEDAAGVFFDECLETVDRLGDAASGIPIRHLLALDPDFEPCGVRFGFTHTYGSNGRKRESDARHAPIVGPVAIAFEKIARDHLSVVA